MTTYEVAIPGGGAILPAGAHPASATLVVGGFTLVVVRFNSIIDVSRLRRGKPLDFSVQLAGVLTLARRYWLELFATGIVGVTLADTGPFAFRGGAQQIVQADSARLRGSTYASDKTTDICALPKDRNVAHVAHRYVQRIRCRLAGRFLV